MKYNRVEIGLLLLFLACGLIAYNTTQTMYFIMVAVTFFVGAVFMRMKTNGIAGNIAELILIYTMSNLCDELFFDPLSLGWNELAFAFIGLFRLDYQLGRYAFKS